MRSKPTKVLRFVMFLGLLILELGLIVAFYILPLFQARNAPATQLEMEMPLPDSLGLRVAVIAYWGLLAVGNLGLMTMVWRAFKELKTTA
jgi:Na+/H+ antiporter NhaA